MSWDNDLERASNGAEDGRQEYGQALPAILSARQLQLTAFPPVSWVVRDMLPEGVTVLAGKPKLGKSWLALQLGYAVACGDEVLGRPVEKGRVLYAALEDNNRRLKSRLEKMSPQLAPWPETFDLATEWPRLDAGGLDAVEGWLDRQADGKLIIIDTLATVRPASSGRETLYQSDYQSIRWLHAIANQRGIAIVLVHHVRKAEADDPFDTVSGSTGLTGAADATLVLTNTSDGKVLYGRGRDLVEFECAVDFDMTTCRWSDLGRPSDVYGSGTRKAIRSAMKGGHQTPKDISEAADLDYDLCAKTLQRMAAGGEVQKGGHGRYRITPDPLSNLSNCPES